MAFKTRGLRFVCNGEIWETLRSRAVPRYHTSSARVGRAADFGLVVMLYDANTATLTSVANFRDVG